MEIPDPVAGALQNLDSVTHSAMYASEDYIDEEQRWQRIDEAIEEVLSTPGNTWTRKQLEYRQRQLHYS